MAAIGGDPGDHDTSSCNPKADSHVEEDGTTSHLPASINHGSEEPELHITATETDG